MRRLSPNARKSPDSYRYRTYGWGQGMPAKNPNLDREIVVAIDEQMARKGSRKRREIHDEIDSDAMPDHYNFSVMGF
jgi:hypothetical protein